MNSRPKTPGLIIGCALWCLPATGFSGSDGDSYQEGLYQLLTIGDADRALAALEQATRQAPAGVTAEEILLQQVTCLEWAGRDKQLEGVIDRIRALEDSAEGELGPSRILPVDAELILQLDLAGLRRAGLWRQLEFALPGGDSVLAKHAKRIAGAINLQERDRGHGARFLLVIEGDFSGFRPDELHADCSAWLSEALAPLYPLLADGASAAPPGKKPVAGIRRVHGVEIHPLSIPLPPGTVDLVMASPGDRLLLLGDPDRVDFALAALAHRRLGLGTDPRAREMRDRLPDGATFWILVAPGGLLQRLAELQASLGLAAQLPSLSRLLISGRLAKKVELDARAWTVDTESARILADLARGGLALASLGAQARGRPEMAEWLHSLAIGSTGQQVSISTSLSVDQLRAAFRVPVTKP